MKIQCDFSDLVPDAFSAPEPMAKFGQRPYLMLIAAHPTLPMKRVITTPT